VRRLEILLLLNFKLHRLHFITPKKIKQENTMRSALTYSRFSLPLLPVVFFTGIGLVAALWQSHKASAGRHSVLDNAAACGALGTKFDAAEHFFESTDVRAVVAGDFNNDALPDVALLQRNRGLVILLGNGRGQFAVAFRLSLQVGDTYHSGGLVITDFNRDDKADLAVGSSGAPVLLGRGDGTFTPATGLSGNIFPVSVAAADYTGDGKTDLAFVSSNGESRLLPGNGDGSFGQATTITPGSFSSSNQAITTTELNNDGKPDLFLCRGGCGVYLNNGAGGFVAGATVDVANALNGFALSDFNGDGNQDLVISSFIDPYRLYPGNGNGSFGAPTSLASGGGALSVGDLNKDGRLDLIGAGSRVVVLLNSATGFGPVNAYAAGRQVSATAVADFNLDGRLDVMAANREDSNFRTGFGLSYLPGDGAGRLRSGLQIPGSSNQTRISVADLNGDGRSDVILSSDNTFSGSGVVVLLSDDQGGFEASQRYLPQGISKSYLDSVAADFNNDNITDIVSLSPRDFDSLGSVTIFPGAGNGRFNQSRAREFDLGNDPVEVVAADFNRDGFIDLATTNSTSNDLSVSINDGRGGFGAERRLAAGLDPRSLITGDINGDGSPDLAVANRNSATVSLFFGDGRGGFMSLPLGVNGNPLAIFAADVNSDNRTDLVVPLSNAANVSVLLNLGMGSFGPPMMTNLGITPAGADSADFTGDGNFDFAVTSVTNERVTIFAGDGAGKFNVAGSFHLPSANALVTGDFNGDGLNDLTVGGLNTIWVMSNACAPPKPALTNLSAANFTGVLFSPEMIVAAFGSGFTPQPVSASSLPLPLQLGGVSIKVKDSAGNERDAPLFFAGPDQVNYLVPAGTAAGAATVTVTASDGKTPSEIVLILPASPGLFSANANGSGVAAGYILRIKAQTGEQSIETISRFDTAAQRFVPVPIVRASGDRYFLVLFGTGIRPSTGAVITASIGGRSVDVLYAGPQGSLAGLDQVNLSLSNVFGVSGEVPVMLTVDGKTAGNVIVAFP
jgi:uncharacterized protein (TIGR03437 family)